MQLSAGGTRIKVTTAWCLVQQANNIIIPPSNKTVSVLTINTGKTTFHDTNYFQLILLINRTMSWNSNPNQYQPGTMNSSSQGVPLGAAPVYPAQGYNTAPIYPASGNPAPMYPTSYSSSSSGVPLGAAPVNSSWSNGTPMGYTDTSNPVWTSTSNSAGVPLGAAPVGFETYSTGQPMGITSDTSFGAPMGYSSSSSAGVPIGATYDGTTTSSSTGAPLGAYPSSGY